MQSKKRIFICLLLAIFLVFSIVGCGPKKVDVIELSATTLFPAGHGSTTQGLQAWADLVDEYTDGRVKVTVYPGGTLLGAGTVLEGVTVGAADVGLDPTSYTPGRLPLLTAFQLGGIQAKSGKVYSYAGWDIIKNELVELDELKNVKVLFFYAISPGHLHTTDKPIRTLEDVKGMEIRTAAVATINKLGATAVAMPMNEAYEALERGIVDAMLGPSEALEGWRLAEVTNYTTFTPFLYSDLHLVSMNLDKWNSLPSDIQQAIDKASEEAFRNTAVLWDEIDESGIKFAVEQTGQELIELSAAEKERWLKVLEPMHDEWIKDMESKGLPGRQMLETLIELVDKYNAEFH